MADATLYERPYTGAYDEAVLAFVVAHPEPGPTYAEIRALLFPPEPPRPIVPRYESPPPTRASSGLEPVGFSALSLAVGFSLGAMF